MFSLANCAHRVGVFSLHRRRADKCVQFTAHAIGLFIITTNDYTFG